MQVSFFWKFYNFICGSNNQLNILHFQYLAIKYLARLLKKILPSLSGVVLDFGCGNQPYKQWIKAERYIGVDLTAAPGVDLVCENGIVPETGPLDALVSTQVLEHVEDPAIYIQLFERLKPGGLMVLSVPFIYQVHDSHDYRRFTAEGVKAWVEANGFLTESLFTQGGIGSTLVMLLLSWMDRQCSQMGPIGKAIKLIGLPFFIPLTFTLNLIGMALDKLDTTGAFYNNTLIVARKKTA